MPIDPWRPKPRRPFPLIPVVLAVLALLDLRVELELLADHFTVTALLEGIRSHPLAVAVLGFQPSLLTRYRRSPPPGSD